MPAPPPRTLSPEAIRSTWFDATRRPGGDCGEQGRLDRGRPAAHATAPVLASSPHMTVTRTHLLDLNLVRVLRSPSPFSVSVLRLRLRLCLRPRSRCRSCSCSFHLCFYLCFCFCFCSWFYFCVCVFVSTSAFAPAPTHARARAPSTSASASASTSFFASAHGSASASASLRLKALLSRTSPCERRLAVAKLTHSRLASDSICFTDSDVFINVVGQLGFRMLQDAGDDAVVETLMR